MLASLPVDVGTPWVARNSNHSNHRLLDPGILITSLCSALTGPDSKPLAREGHREGEISTEQAGPKYTKPRTSEVVLKINIITFDLYFYYKCV